MSSKRRKRYKSCERKIAHASKPNAIAAKLALIKSKDHLDGLVSVYKCHFCHKWHVGKTPRGSYIGRRIRGAQ